MTTEPSSSPSSSLTDRAATLFAALDPLAAAVLNGIVSGTSLGVYAGAIVREWPAVRTLITDLLAENAAALEVIISLRDMNRENVAAKERAEAVCRIIDGARSATDAFVALQVAMDEWRRGNSDEAVAQQQ